MRCKICTADSISWILPAQTVHRFILGRRKEHVISLIALIDEVMQGLAGVMRIIAIDGNPFTIVYIFLENVARDTGTEDEEILFNLFLSNHDILRSEIVFCCLQQIRRRLCICNHDLITANNCADGADGVVLLGFLIQIPILNTFCRLPANR